MQHDNADEASKAAGNTDRDALGELIQAAGRRPTPSTEQYGQTFAAVHTAWQRKVRSTQRRQRIYAIAATFAAVAIGIGAVLQLAPTGPIPHIATAVVVRGDSAVFSPETGSWQPLIETGAQVGPGSRLRTEANGRSAFLLGEEISVRLNIDSEIVFHSVYEIELVAGTVYVDSGPDDVAGDLEVTTTHGTLRDVGTQFEVAAVADGLRVRVREGLVQLYQSGQAAEFEGGAGEEFRIDAAGTIRPGLFSRYDPAWGWAEALAGPPNVNGMPVLEFLNWVSRETGRQIRYEDGVQLAAGTAVLHGSAQDLTPMDALEVMLATTDFVYELSRNGVIVISRRDATR